MNSNNCLTTEIKHEFLDGKLSTEVREIAEAHLSGCGACRRQMAILFSEIKKDEAIPLPKSLKEKAKVIPLQQTNGKQSFFAAVLAFFQKPVAVAASVLLLIAVTSIAFIALREKESTRNSQREKFRQGNAASNKPQLLSPTADSLIATGQIEFRWSKVINALSYTVIVLDENGDIITQKATTQESLTLNADALNLTNTKHFFWFVRVKLADGTSSNSDTAKFLLQNKF